MNRQSNDHDGTLERQALAALRKMRRRLDEIEAARAEPIAIVGMGCRLPSDANDPDGFWSLLRDGIDAVREIPLERWDVAEHFDPAQGTPGKTYSRWGGFLRRVDEFDAEFFGISPREARRMDPQQRIFMEVAWEALEDAGIPAHTLKESNAGIFVGATTTEYLQQHLRHGDARDLDAYMISGNALNAIAGRLAYFLGTHGPTITLDTACSSSLVAVDRACRSLRDGECELAITGGVNVLLAPEPYVCMSKWGMLSPEGRCRTFDSGANGFVRAEGCGVVVLKRMSQALADGDRILALIRATAINQDGPSSGLSVPNGLAQAALIRKALGEAKLGPEAISYVEAHGTGTSLGDPIEVEALGQVFDPASRIASPLTLGSVKTNLGHLESAAGITGLLKVVLMLQHRQIPPHLHFEQPTPHIAWERYPFSIPTRLTDWQPVAGKRIAGVSSFGASGTNAHVVVEEAPQSEPAVSQRERPLHLLTLSARHEEALHALARRFADALGEQSAPALADACFTANAGRSHFAHRLSVVADTAESTHRKLDAFLSGQAPAGVISSRLTGNERTRIAFLFTGQGSQYVGVGRELYHTSPTFREALDRCGELLRPLMDRPLHSVLYPDGEGDGALDRTLYAQPALFAVEYALARLWKSWGVEPSFVLGHSLGEYVAACVAGMIDLEDALKLIVERARLMQALPAGGCMAVVRADEARVRAAAAPFARTVSIAAVNGPANVVVSGAAADVEAVLARLSTEGVQSERLNVSHAFHSPLMEPVLDAFENVLRGIELRPPQVRLVSNVTGRVAKAEEVTQPEYWRTHLREAVRFHAGVGSLVEAGCNVFLEMGPRPVLVGMARQCVEDQGHAWLASLRPERGDWAELLASLQALYHAGVAVNWQGFDADYRRRKTRCPTYPFQRHRYWFRRADAGAVGGHRPVDGAARHPLLGERRRVATVPDTFFEIEVSAATLAALDGHRINGAAVLPAAAYVDALIIAGCAAHGVEDVALLDLSIIEPLVIAEQAVRTVQIAVGPVEASASSCRLFSAERTADGREPVWTLHASAALRLGERAAAAGDVAELRRRISSAVDLGAQLASLARAGLEFGAGFKGLTSLWKAPGESLGHVIAPDALESTDGAVIEPELLDACFQAAVPLLADGGEGSGAGLAVPVAIERCVFGARGARELWSHAIQRKGTASERIVIDLEVFDRDGRAVAVIDGLTFQRVDAAALQRSGTSGGWLYRTVWEARPQRNPQPAQEGELLPAPRSVAAHVEATLDLRSAAFGVAALERRFEDLEALATRYIIAALEVLGWRLAVGEAFTADRLADRLGIEPRHRRFLARMLEILSEDGVLEQAGDAWRVARLPQPTSMDELEARLAADPERAAELGLLRRVGRQLAPALRGAVEAVDLLFPDGSLALAERLYEESPLFRPYNAAIEEALAVVRARLPSDRPLRVLEVGAGTGATTARLLRRLAGQAVEYTFTDVSTAFLTAARNKFRDYPGTSYRQLDVEQDPHAQGFEAGHYDCIVAANVLHATRRLRDTLGNVQQLLAPGGLLLLLEGAKPLRLGDVIVGLTDGWWRFEDRELRPAHALMPPARWLELLAELGFEDATTVPARPAEQGPLSHHLVVVARAAQRHGVATAPQAAGCWVLLEDESGVGTAVGRLLADRGARVVSVRRGDRFERVDASRFHLDPSEPDHFRRLLREVRELEPAGCAGVAHFWSLDIEEPATNSNAALSESQLLGCGAALHLLHAVARDAVAPPPLWLITRGAQAAGDPVASVSAVQAPLWGLGGTIAREHADLACTRIDLNPDPDANEAEEICRELLNADDEEQVALRDNVRYVARLAPVTSQRDDVETGTAEQLVVAQPGTLDGIAFRRGPRRAPEPGEVEIAVEAGGLNFRDVLRVLGAYPDDGGEPLGVECSGRIAAVGEGVLDFAPGDRVLAIANGAFGTFALARAELVAPLPPALSMAEGAAVPSAYLSAHYALITLAGLRAGERVLIHCGSGGVGLAALQVARSVGAEVVATAGSARKRKYLESLGIASVFDSRSTAFEAQVLQATDGQGVDVVLNSLNGDAIAASVRTLAAGGRFIELGRRGIWTSAQMAAAAPGVAYHTVNLAETCKREPARAGALLRDVLARLTAGTLAPLPVTAVPVEDAQAAFRYMAQARHIGKIVLMRKVSPAEGASTTLEPRASYLITGGLASVGLRVAEWMVEQGARALVLMARSAPSESARRVIEQLERRGVTVTVVQADVTRRSDVRATLATIPAERPLRGVVHCAGVLDDGALVQQTWTRFAAVLAPKVDGSWHLHTLTTQMPLDFFVCFSSAVSVFGSPGQGSHAAACAYQDALAWQRAARGLPALSVNWGPWSDIGSVVRRDVGERLRAKGFAAFSPEEGVRALQTMLRQTAAPQLIAARVDWRAYLRDAPGGRRVHAYFERLAAVATPRPAAAARAPGADLLTRLREARASERRKLLQTHVREQVEAVLGFEVGARIEATHGLRDLGIDSLMSIELRNRLQASVGQPLPSTLAFDYPNIAALTDFLLRQLPALADDGKTETEPGEAAPDRAALAEVGRLSQAEAESELLAELARAEQRHAI